MSDQKTGNLYEQRVKIAEEHEKMRAAADKAKQIEESLPEYAEEGPYAMPGGLETAKLKEKQEIVPVSPWTEHHEIMAEKQGFELAQRKAKMYASSDLLPDHFRGKVANCMIAMEYAARLGLTPIQLMQQMHVINGKPGLSSTMIIALCNGCGQFSKIRFHYSGKGDTRACFASATDRETGEELIGPEMSVSAAKKEGYWDKKGSKWPAFTDVMLAYRAATLWSRLYASHITLGMYSVDELQDINREANVIQVNSLEALAEVLEAETQGPHGQQ